jgi:hypothetical protein
VRARSVRLGTPPAAMEPDSRATNRPVAFISNGLHRILYIDTFIEIIRRAP